MRSLNFEKLIKQADIKILDTSVREDDELDAMI